MNMAQPNMASPGQQGGSFGGGQAITSAGGGDGGFDNVQNSVIDAIKGGGQSDSGMSVMDITQQLSPQGITEQQIRAAIEFLSGEGHLYSTVDENHYKSTM